MITQNAAKHVLNLHVNTAKPVNSTTKFKCLFCFKNLEIAKDEEKNPDFKCQCVSCQAKIELKNAARTVSCKVQVKKNYETKTFTINNNVFKSFLMQHDKQNCTTDEIDDFLLDVDTVAIEHVESEDIVTEITIID